MRSRGGNDVRFHSKLMLIICSLLFGVIVILGTMFEQMLAGVLEDEIGTRALHTAKTVAQMSEIKQAFDAEDPAKIINPIVEKIRVDTNAAFITVGNLQSIRYSHPDPEQIGKKMVGGDNEAVFEGESIISETVGSLGPGLRGKTPIYDAEGKVMGVVSVGFLFEDINETIESYRNRIFVIGIVTLLLGVVATLILSQNVKKAIFGLEPEQIGRLYQENQAVLESIREGIVAVNKEGAITLANQTALQMLGQAKDKDRIMDKQDELVRSLGLHEVIETGKAEFDRETNVDEHVLVVNRVPIMDKERHVMGAVASFRNRSELFEVTQELSRVKEYAEVLRSQTHEYSNKLHLISGLIQLESYQEAIETISSELNVHVHNTTFILQEVPDPLIGGLLLGKLNQANERKVELKIDPESNFRDIPASIDRSQLIVILGNLIDNAMDAVKAPGAIAPEITIFLLNMEEVLLIEVEDLGPGISEENAERIFELGFSTKQQPNHGYGLHLVKQAVLHVHGNITHTGNPAGGTIFTVTIPKDARTAERKEAVLDDTGTHY
ncbi:sensor histidine kinase [Brevibacillus formosus]|uniref:ATP-binding protein n=1 Tax=Brevibacillus formosus TaxID=54913 RepID=UPI0018CCC040|nr:sensor histidine kinase [Brevibacillus formosus]